MDEKLVSRFINIIQNYHQVTDSRVPVYSIAYLRNLLRDAAIPALEQMPYIVGSYYLACKSLDVPVCSKMLSSSVAQLSNRFMNRIFFKAYGSPPKPEEITDAEFKLIVANNFEFIPVD